MVSTEIDIEELRRTYQNLAEYYKKLRIRKAAIDALSENSDALAPGRVALSSDAGDYPEIVRGELWAVNKSIDQIENELKEVQDFTFDESLLSRVEALEDQLSSLVYPVRETEGEQTRLAIQRASLNRLDEGIREKQLELQQLEQQLQQESQQRGQIDSAVVSSSERAILETAAKWQELSDLL